MFKLGLIGGTVPLLPAAPTFGRNEVGHFGHALFTSVQIGGTEVTFVPRHGQHHNTPPHQVNYIANLATLRRQGITHVVALSAMGGLTTGYDPGTLVLVNDIINRTHGRTSTIFEHGIVGHVPRGLCPHLHSLACAAAESVGVAHQKNGTLVVINGPQFSSRAESAIHRRDGAQMVGMTSCPEAEIAREMGMCYIVLGMITDRDNPEDGSPSVTQAMVSEHRIKQQLAQNAFKVLEAMLELAQAEHDLECSCEKMRTGAILTPRERFRISDSTLSRMEDIFGQDGIPDQWFAHA